MNALLDADSILALWLNDAQTYHRFYDEAVGCVLVSKNIVMCLTGFHICFDVISGNSLSARLGWSYLPLDPLTNFRVFFFLRPAMSVHQGIVLLPKEHRNYTKTSLMNADSQTDRV